MLITDFIHSAAQTVQGGQAALGDFFGVNVGQLNADLAVLNALMPQQPPAQPQQSPAQQQRPSAQQPDHQARGGIDFRGIWDRYWIIISIFVVLLLFGLGWMIVSALSGGDSDGE